MAELRRLLLGEGEREGAPEPSLLPHLARWVEPGAIELLVRTAEQLALQGGMAPPWFPLWEATVDAALHRGAQLAEDLETEVRRVVVEHGETAADRLLADIPAPDGPTGAALRCFLAPLLGADQLAQLGRSVRVEALPAEPARRLLAASTRAGMELPDDLVRRLLEGAGSNEYPYARRAHLLPDLPEVLRAKVADELVTELATYPPLPPWYLVLVASRVAPFATATGGWEAHPVPPPWESLLATLLRAAPATAPHGDVLRAHPHARELAAVEGIHETSVEALHALGRWVMPLAAAEPPPEPEPAVPRGVPRGVPSPPRREAAPAPTGAAPEAVERRLQVDVLAGDAPVERAFVAGTNHDVVFSIGRGSSISASAPMAEPEFDEGEERIALTVRFAVGDQMQEGVVQLPKDRSRNSTPWTFAFPVAADAKNASALLAVYDGLVLLQAAVLSGGVVADLDSEKAHGGAIDLQVNALVHQLAAAPPSRTEGSIVSDGQQIIAAHAAGAIAVDASALAERIEPLWDRLEAAAGLLHDGQEEELDRLLRDLAIHGRSLRARFVQQLPAELLGGGPIQVVAADPTAILPLELVYDGRQPTSASAICADWRAALAGGSCNRCPSGAEEADRAAGDPNVCPLHFWGLRRVIEHHTGLGGASGGFQVRSERVDSESALPVLEGAVVAASARVDEAGVEATVAAARKAFGRASRATTWEEWEMIVQAERASVLVLMPHQASDEETSPPIRALEVGDKLLAEGALTPSHVRRANGPGPVVLLLGCNTAGDELPVTSFAGEFRRNGAAFVVSTLVEVIADEAPRAAQVLIDALTRAQVGGGATTVGEALLQARRALLAEGMVFSLGVIGHGDPEWQLTGGR